MDRERCESQGPALNRWLRDEAVFELLSVSFEKRNAVLHLEEPGIYQNPSEPPLVRVYSRGKSPLERPTQLPGGLHARRCPRDHLPQQRVIALRDSITRHETCIHAHVLAGRPF